VLGYMMNTRLFYDGPHIVSSLAFFDIHVQVKVTDMGLGRSHRRDGVGHTGDP
jgi:hypothetical protein